MNVYHGPMSRRCFLRATGVGLALPWLDAMAPSARAATPAPKRLVFIGQPLGLHGPNLFPTQTGRAYEPTPYLKILAGQRDKLSVISGLSHPGYKAGHSAEIALLTGAPWDDIKSERFLRNTVSVDQIAVEKVGRQTRFPNLVLGSNVLSWNRRGVRLPADGSCSSVFAKLFIDGKPDERQRVVRDLQDGRSILDRVRANARSLQASVGKADHARLEQYFASIREAEQRLAQDEAWAAKPKPKVDAKPPQNNLNEDHLIERTSQWYDVIHLALQTDSTRVITLWLGGGGALYLPDGTRSKHYHDLSHHGQDPRKIDELSKIESAQMKALAAFLGKLDASKEEGGSLLDHTTVFFSSNLSNANSHSNENLPVLLAGGGFRHGQHIGFEAKKNRPLANLYLTMLQRFGIETERFASSTGTISEL